MMSITILAIAGISICFLIPGSLGSDICQYIEVSGAVYHNKTNGVYTLHEEIHCNGRPAWEDAAGKNFVYYLLDGFDGWMVAPTSCYHWGNFMIMAKSEAEFPYEVNSSTWKEFCPVLGEWKKADNLRIRCLQPGYSPPPPGPSTTPGLEPSTIRDDGGPPEIYICQKDSCPKGKICSPDSSGDFECFCDDGFFTSKECQLTIGRSALTAILIISIFAGASTVVLAAIVICVRVRRAKILRASEITQYSPQHSMLKYKPLDESASDLYTVT